MRNVMLGLTPLVMTMSGSAVAAEPLWRVSEVSGEVRLVQSGRTLPAVKGAMLAAGSTIATGPNAKAVIVRGEEFVVISPRTQLRVPADTAPNRIMQLIEDFGTALFKIEKKSTPHFGVQTPYLAAVVKGTTFTVTAGAGGGSVQVTEGAVQVSTLDGGAAELVHPGTIAMVGASDLFRLNVEGETSKVIRSPIAAAASSSSVAPAVKSVAYAGPPGEEIKITKRFEEDIKSLKESTRGLIEDQSTPAVVQAEFREQAEAARKDGVNPGNGDGSGNPGKDGGKPDNPSKPDGAGKPSKPDKPDDAGKPSKPERPDDAGKPSKPERPDDADKPAKPGDADNPSKPDKPGDADKPSKPEKPGDVDKPSKPGDAGKPSDPDGSAGPGNPGVGLPDDGGNKGPGKPPDPQGSGHGSEGRGPDNGDGGENKGPGGGGKGR